LLEAYQIWSIIQMLCVKHAKKENLLNLPSSLKTLSQLPDIQNFLFRPVSTTSICGKKYELVIVDDYSKWNLVKFLRSRMSHTMYLVSSVLKYKMKRISNIKNQKWLWWWKWKWAIWIIFVKNMKLSIISLVL